MKRISILSIVFLFTFTTVELIALTKAEIRTQCRYLLNDTNSQRWANSVIDGRMEIAQVSIARKSKCLQGTTTYIIYSSTKEYTLPSDLLFTERVSLQIGTSTSTYELLPRWTLLGLDNDNKYWQNQANGKPLKYYIWGNKLGIVPPASTSYAGADKLQIHYIINPSSMTADTSIPFNGHTQLYSYHELIIWWVCMMCKLDEQRYGEAQTYENKYKLLLDEMIKEIQIKGDDWSPSFKM